MDEGPEKGVVLVPQVVEARPDEELVERVHALQHVHPIGLSRLWDRVIGLENFQGSHATLIKEVCSAG